MGPWHTFDVLLRMKVALTSIILFLMVNASGNNSADQAFWDLTLIPYISSAYYIEKNEWPKDVNDLLLTASFDNPQNIKKALSILSKRIKNVKFTVKFRSLRISMDYHSKDRGILSGAIIIPRGKDVDTMLGAMTVKGDLKKASEAPAEQVGRDNGMKSRIIRRGSKTFRRHRSVSHL